jgi:catechol 2,3-dioxygenase-like lactoylglutathione lyase family enzyme
MIQGVDHVQITIPPGTEERAREFYCSLLEIKEIEKPDNLKPRGGFWLQAGSEQVHVGTEEGVDRHRTKAHVAYRVSDLDSWRKKLLARNIEILEGLPIPGADRFEFRDPFGNRVEFIQRK